MSFSFMHSTAEEPELRVPEIGLVLKVRMEPSMSDGAMTIIETENAPGFGPPLHRHKETEIFQVLEGRYLYELDGKRFYADEGDMVTIPGGAVHAFRNATDKPARQLIIICPGLDATGFFSGLADVMKGGHTNTEALNAFSKKWEIEFLGPPIS